jgi:hypothetical protein
LVFGLIVIFHFADVVNFPPYGGQISLSVLLIKSRREFMKEMKRRKFNAEFKESAVRLSEIGDKGVTQLERELA